MQQVRRRAIGRGRGPGIVAGALQALEAFEVASRRGHRTSPEEHGAYLIEILNNVKNEW